MVARFVRRLAPKEHRDDQAGEAGNMPASEDEISLEAQAGRKLVRAFRTLDGLNELLIMRWIMKTQKKRFWGCGQLVIFRLVSVLVLGLFFPPGCGMQQSANLSDQRLPPKPESAPIEIYYGDPNKPYIALGQVVASPSLFESAIDKIKEMARKMGGDAVINYSDYSAPSTSVAPYAFTAQGLVVRWKKEDQSGLNKKLRGAAFIGNLPAVKQALAAGAAVNAKNEDSINALMAASLQGHVEVVQTLLAAGAEVNARNKDGFTPLMYASMRGHQDVLQVLLNARADVNMKTTKGITALEIASMRGHQKAKEMLLKAGAK